MRVTSMMARVTGRVPSAGKKSVPPASTCPPSARAWVASRSVVGRRNKESPWRTSVGNAEVSSPFYTKLLGLVHQGDGRDVLESTELRKIRFHDLRHSF